MNEDKNFLRIEKKKKKKETKVHKQIFKVFWSNHKLINLFWEGGEEG